MDMCPDHYAIYNIEDMIEWAEENDSECLVIETAGLCHRCAPYTVNSLGVCVIDATSGPNTPLKGRSFLEHCRYCGNNQGRYDIPGRKGDIPGKDP